MLFKTSDGKVFKDYQDDEAYTHQSLLRALGDDGSISISLDDGEHWDWKYGYPDGRAGWHRTEKEEEKNV